jgi:hypothetical protein
MFQAMGLPVGLEKIEDEALKRVRAKRRKPFLFPQ